MEWVGLVACDARDALLSAGQPHSGSYGTSPSKSMVGLFVLKGNFAYPFESMEFLNEEEARRFLSERQTSTRRRDDRTQRGGRRKPGRIPLKPPVQVRCLAAHQCRSRCLPRDAWPVG